MYRHYLLVALRNARRAPFTTAINVLTLALGFACFLTTYGVVGFWNRSEQHFANFARTYVVTTSVTPREGGAGGGTNPVSNPYIAQYLKTDFPQVAAVARARVAGARTPVGVDERVERLFNVSVDPEFLQIFDLPVIAGDSQAALREPRSAVLTRDAATRLFGSADAIGRSLLLQNLLEVTVRGVIDPIPEPSHMGRSATAGLRFDLLTSMDVFDWFEANGRNPNLPPPPENWLATGITTYVMLPADGSFPAAELGGQLTEFVARHAPPLQLGFADVVLGLMPVAEVLGRSSLGTFFLRDTGVTVPTALLLLGALVLGVACVNYANLATARATGRARDVGLRKVFGARASQVIAQHLFEAALLTTAAFAVAFATVALLTPVLRTAAGIDLGLTLFEDARVWAQLAVVAALVAALAGAYPAFVLSRFRPVLTLRAGKLRFGARSLATLLVAVQFAVSSFLLITVAVIYLQNQELKRTGLGITSDPLLVVQNDRTVTKVDPSTLRDELLRLPQVSAVGSMAWAPWTIYHLLSLSLAEEQGTPERLIFRYIVGYDFFPVFQIPVLAGRVFDREHADMPRPQEPQNIVVDRALIEEFQLGSPSEAVGQLVYIPKRLTAGFGGGGAQPMRIVGVVETQPLAVMGTGAQSTIYTFADPLPVQIVRIAASDVGGGVAAIDDLWGRLAPGVAIERRFVDDFFNQSYENFARINQTFTGLTSLALLISTIGLFSMALLVANSRAHEVGVRKTLGASTLQMIVLLLKSFSGPVVLANVIAWPLAFMMARTYLNAFIYPIDLTPLPFVACLVITLAVAWLVVAAHTFRAAALKPANVLRAE